jgi:ketosteroid isomerase-like protein
MKTLSTVCFGLIVCLFSVCTGSELHAQVAGPELRKEIVTLRNQWMTAEMKKDIPYLDRLMAQEFVVGNSQGQVMDKAHYLQSQARADRILDIGAGRDQTVSDYGNVVILTESLILKATDKGVPFGGEFRFVRIFVKKNDGKWHPVLAQGTPITHK